MDVAGLIFEPGPSNFGIFHNFWSCFDAFCTTFCHYSKRFEPWSMILGHNIQWIRGKLWPNDKFWPLLLENLRKIEKTINFSSKSRNFKKCVPGLQLAPNSSGTNFRMFRLILEISTMAFFHICDILEFEVFGSKILFN